MSFQSIFNIIITADAQQIVTHVYLKISLTASTADYGNALNKTVWENTVWLPLMNVIQKCYLHKHFEFCGLLEFYWSILLVHILSLGNVATLISLFSK